MTTTDPSREQNITRDLEAMRRGDAAAAERLWLLVDGKLRALARARLHREGRNALLQTTALVNETYVRLVRAHAHLRWQDRAHFFALAARAMRRVLVDSARREKRRKRGGGAQRVELADCDSDAKLPTVDILALEEALTRLAGEHARSSRVVELRFLAGLSIEEVAEVLGIATRTVSDDWFFAKAFLRRELTKGTQG